MACQALFFAKMVELTDWEKGAIKGWRWMPITLPALREKGARRFAWVLPGERLRTRECGANGGFAYDIVGDDDRARCVYFPLQVKAKELWRAAGRGGAVISALTHAARDERGRSASVADNT